DHGDQPQGLQRTAHVISPPLLASSSITSMTPPCPPPACGRLRSGSGNQSSPLGTPGDRPVGRRVQRHGRCESPSTIPAMVTLRPACFRAAERRPACYGIRSLKAILTAPPAVRLPWLSTAGYG